jgi:hypothetical protein
MNRKKTGKALVVGGTPRVNLLPPQEVEERHRKLLRMRYLRAFILTLVVLGLQAVVASALNSAANTEQAAAVQTSAELQAQLAKYSMVIDVQSQVRSLNGLRAQAGSNDQEWGPLIAEINAVLPTGVALIGFKLAPGEAPKPGADASAQVGLKGTLTFSAKTTSAQAETIMRLRTVKTFIDVDAGELSSDGPAGGVTFVTTFSADQTRYTGRFVQSGSK